MQLIGSRLQGDWESDPRLNDLGQRAVLRKDERPNALQAVEADPSEFLSWRIQQGVAEGDTEMPSGQPLLLEIHKGKGKYALEARYDGEQYKTPHFSLWEIAIESWN